MQKDAIEEIRNRKKRMAICYDFDKTLSPDDMQAFTLIPSLEMDKSEYEFYLDLRKYGSVPHAGFGIGIERMVTFVAGTKHIREAIPFPRMLHRLKP